MKTLYRSVSRILTLFIILCGTFSCKKYLDMKSDASLSTPSTLEDLQAILDNTNINGSIFIANASSDEYYVANSTYPNLFQPNAEAYIWAPRAGARADMDDWRESYRFVFSANTILDNLGKIDAGKQQDTWNALKGSALFFRAMHFFELAQIYAPQYNAETASTDPGIALRLNSNFNETSVRATVEQTYKQIINDLQEALSLLSDDGGYKTRPSKPAAYGLLARIYLQMGNYEAAAENATFCLEKYNTLLNYNNAPDIFNPFERFNSEVIFYAMEWTSPVAHYDYYAIIDSVLYDSYHQDDLRKTLFFEDIHGDGTYRFTGNYNGNAGVDGVFTGLATDEIYLIRAECYARLNKVDEALADLNTLLITRWKHGLFNPITTPNADEALQHIITERKKELVYRSLRWYDLRRLNKEERFAKTLTRILNGETYTLPPNDLRYTFLIPEEVLLRSNIEQNPR
jgi:starch-binding outer membrane protein, SusD/RagB family